ncbi:fimbrial biogenesis chaperone [Rhizobacter sp. P5_C2]
MRPPRARATWAALPLALSFALSLALGAAPAAAGVFTISPVRLHMAPRDRAVAVALGNDGDSPLVLQAELFLWRQDAAGADVLTPTDDLVLAPPIVKLDPGGRQVVRLAMVVPRDAARQLTYRLVMREVPEALPGAPGVSVPVALAMSLPVFVTPPAARRDLACTLQRDGAQLLAQCENRGSAYAQVRELRVLRAGRQLARFDGGAYVLPGASRPIALQSDPDVAPGPAQLALLFDDGSRRTDELALP